ncbi:MAG TPA: histidine kinase [Solirubrobacteraceae bacterium]|nr:histidine kinase [Solirubrobacteraceae bacterium]
MSVIHLAPSKVKAPGAWLGSSEMGQRVGTFDWSTTPLGPLSGWPQSLTTAVSICLRSQFQMAIYWGPELNCIYNDAERDVLGKLHPGALGQPAHELLRDSWQIVGPQLEAVVERGDSTWAEDQPLTFDRRGALEVSYFTYSYSPILDDDGGVGGVLLVTHETTARVLGERRIDAIRARRRSEERARHEGELRAVLNDLRAAQRRVAVAGDAERRRIERDLHDGAQQRLMALRLELGLLQERVRDDPNRATEILRGLRRDLDEALEELRELAHGLYPPLLASDGLEAALAATARRSAIPVTIEASGMTRVPRSIESAAYFCCLEALQNAAKHAGPRARASIELRMEGGFLSFSVRDDGAGFDPGARRPGSGLINLRDRLSALGGDASVASSPGAGTTVTGHIPLP